MEALTEILFPRKNDLCTQYPTEKIIRLSLVESLQIKVIPDPQRSAEEQSEKRKYRETITIFEQLPYIMERATAVRKIEKARSANDSRRAFSRDVLSVEIAGPGRPQLTVVDLPGIIQAEIKDASRADVDMAIEITESYISQPRTICLAVVSATNDYANQPILDKVRLCSRIGHSRRRNLMNRLSRLYTYIQRELPRLQENLDVALRDTTQELTTTRVTTFNQIISPSMCDVRKRTVRRLRAAIQFLNKSFSQEMEQNGHKYQIRGLKKNVASSGQLALDASHDDPGKMDPDGQCFVETLKENELYQAFHTIKRPQKMTHRKAMAWIDDVVTKARGRELLGNFNPLVISELFWEQSSKWRQFGQAHIQQTSDICCHFLQSVLSELFNTVSASF
ncbi:hypothetical protein FE257_004100 [Aspergillus nanangensis]|uniref:Dynamin N-terminal domain-containing protein n=1 Tax=Aspergillus nanangensis TaxID=2582783 RepID=A0AAD4GN48_ASPNN|nr:hypothetical protein FE257_004100 [Aspergillus nanangensis]